MRKSSLRSFLLQEKEDIWLMMQINRYQTGLLFFVTIPGFLLHLIEDKGIIKAINTNYPVKTKNKSF